MAERARALLRRMDSSLTERQIKTVLYMYDNGYTLTVIMQRFHIAEQQVHKIVADAGRKLRGTHKF